MSDEATDNFLPCDYRSVWLAAVCFGCLHVPSKPALYDRAQPEGNNIPTDYVGTSFYYLDRAEGKPSSLPKTTDRSVTDPESFIVTFFPSSASIATFMNLALSLTPIKNEWAGFISLTPSATDWWTQAGFQPTIGLAVEPPKAGNYTVFVEGLTGPGGSMLQLRVNDEPVRNIVDFYAPKQGRSGPQKLGEVSLMDGKNLFYLMLAGKNARSTGAVVDLISVRGTRLQ